MEHILETENLSVRFGGLVAVDGVSLRVRRGSLQSLIGPNGAGKTTLFNLICGICRPTGGHVRFRGRDVTGLPPHRIAQLGLGRSFQITNIFPNLTVLENVRLAVQAGSGVSRRFLTSAEGLFVDRARVLLAEVGLAEKEGALATNLAHGEKRKLEIGMLLATEAELLLLDEPTAGMSHDDVPEVMALIQRVKAAGKTILMVEHKMEIILAISDVITVLKQGAVIAEGPPQAIAADPLVRSAYLGGMAG